MAQQQQDYQEQSAPSKDTSSQAGIIRILAVALLVALVAIVALSFALCSRQEGQTHVSSSVIANTSSESTSHSSSAQHAPAIPADAASESTSSQQTDAVQDTWDSETDDEFESGTSAAQPADDGANIAANANDAAVDAYVQGEASIDENGSYTSKDEVALYIHTYGHLPSNYISKTKARNAGWVAKEGNLDDVLPGMSIGGSEFYNNEGRLPDAAGRTWTECDINYEGGYRGAERIVFSNDGLIFYTADHYETFEQLY